jgi:transglutaminase-like putative cysteine protease
MAAVVNRSYLQASPSLATDLARYGPTAVWRGVYYRGEKIGFLVSQTSRADDGFELQEDGRLQMLLLGQDSAATLRTTARVDTSFALRSFTFSLDPGTGAIEVAGTVEPSPGRDVSARRLTLSITSAGATRTEVRELEEPPVLSLNLARMLAGGGLVADTRHRWLVLDPATLRLAPVQVRVRERTMIRTEDSRVPAFRVELEFQGLRTTSWMTDTGDVVREESPLGLMTVRETRERAQLATVPGTVRADMLRAAAIVPSMGRLRIDEPRDVLRLRLLLEGADVPRDELDGVGQTVTGDELEMRDPKLLRPGPIDAGAARYLAPEPFIESDAPEIVAEAEAATRGATDDRTRAERLTRYVSALLDKKPTISVPSAREVLRTKVGDCNEHTALYVAMARASGIPARIAVGLVYMHGAFYYHAWPEVYLREGERQGLWLPVDPTLNQFPADTTHLRLARGGLDKQAVILPLIGRLRITVLDLELAPGTTPILVGRQPAADLGALPIDLPPASGACSCTGDDQ